MFIAFLLLLKNRPIEIDFVFRELTKSYFKNLICFSYFEHITKVDGFKLDNKLRALRHINQKFAHDKRTEQVEHNQD